MHIWLCCIAIGAPSFSLCKYLQILPRNVQVLPAEVKDAQQKKLEELKQQSDVHFRIELERKMALRYRKVKFFGMCSYGFLLVIGFVSQMQIMDIILEKTWTLNGLFFSTNFFHTFMWQRGERLSVGYAGLRSSKEHLMTIHSGLLTLQNSSLSSKRTLSMFGYLSSLCQLIPQPL